MSLRLWLDESRPPPDESWTVCRTVNDAKVAIRADDNVFQAASLDHDLSLSAYLELGPSGLTFVRWLVRNRLGLDADIEVHSQNPVAGGRMVRELRRAGYRVRWRPYGGFFGVGWLRFDRTFG